MRKLLLGSAALAALIAGPAVAADLPVKAPVYKAPPRVVVFSWTGFYIGGNVGGAWSRADVTSTLVPGPALPGIGAVYGVPANLALANALGTGTLDNHGIFTGGAQIGFNWQVAQSGLIGLEADFSSFSQSSNLIGTGVSTNGPMTVTNSLTTHWLATVRGRLGATFDRVLVYVTGGAAFTSQSYGQTLSVPADPVFGTSSAQSTKTGWTAGGGIEWALWDAWTVKAEYLYAQFGGPNTTTLVCRPNCGAPIGAQNYVGATGDLHVHIARIGINYRFGYAPIVAKY